MNWRMVVLKIYSADSDSSEPISILRSGEYILGRGTLLETDKHVSRSHAKIIVGDTVTLQALHVNPSFLIAKGSEEKRSLYLESNPAILESGDKFAFWEEWYRVDVSEVDLDLPITNNIEEFVNNNLTEDGGSRTSLKRHVSSNDFEYCTKKLKSDNDSTEDIPCNTNETVEINNADELTQRINVSESSEINLSKSPQKLNLAEGSENSNVVLYTNLNTSDSESEDNDIIKDKYVCINGNIIKEDEELLTNELRQQSITNLLESSNDNTKDFLPETKFSNDLIIASSSNLNNFNNNDQINDADNKSSVNFKSTNSSNLTSNDCQQRELTDLIGTSDTTGSRDSTTLPNTSKDNTNQSNESKRREQCWYGDSCYRKDPTHKSNFSHPYDFDWPPDPSDDRPECLYGASCYRKNRIHRQEYRHPTPRPAPFPSNSHRRRAVAQNPTYELDCDEEDVDPFDVESSSSENDFGEEESDESIGSEESDEETKLLFKEAQKFKRQFKKK